LKSALFCAFFDPERTTIWSVVTVVKYEAVPVLDYRVAAAAG
jgi:hypothetical protein